MFPWLLGQKIAVPDRVAGYVHRAELVNRAMPTRRRVTVLNASAGFGKTTLLAECCRRLRRDGVATAWVSLDEQDEPAVLDTYIAFACHDAGLNLLEVSDLAGTSAGPESRVGVVVHQIQRLGRPFVIAFDELERLTNPASVSLLEFLLQRGPSNLHLAIACRSIPARPSSTEPATFRPSDAVDFCQSASEVPMCKGYARRGLNPPIGSFLQSIAAAIRAATPPTSFGIKMERTV